MAVDRGPADPEHPGDVGHGVLSGLAELAGPGHLGQGHDRGPAPRPPPGPGRLQAGHGAFPDQVPLELGQRPEEVEHELAPRGGGVDGLGQAPEPDLVLALIGSPGEVHRLGWRFSDVDRAAALAAAFVRAKPSRLYLGATSVFEARAYFDPEARKWRVAARYLPGDADVPLES